MNIKEKDTPHGAWQGISGGYREGFAKWPGLAPVIEDGRPVPSRLVQRPLPPGRMVLGRHKWRTP